MSDTPPPDLLCPFCGEARQIEATDDGLFWLCGVCSKVWGQDRPALNESDRRMLRARGIDPGAKSKPWGTY